MSINTSALKAKRAFNAHKDDGYYANENNLEVRKLKRDHKDFRATRKNRHAKLHAVGA